MSVYVVTVRDELTGKTVRQQLEAVSVEAAKVQAARRVARQQGWSWCTATAAVRKARA